MKKLLLSTLAFLPLVSMAQQPFTLHGSVKSLKSGDKIYLLYKVDGTNNRLDNC